MRTTQGSILQSLRTVQSLQAKIGELALEHDVLERALGSADLLSAKR